MTNRNAPRHLRAVLDRTSPRPSDYAIAWLTVHGDRHWPQALRVESRSERDALRRAATIHAVLWPLEDLFPTRPIPVVVGSAA